MLYTFQLRSCLRYMHNMCLYLTTPIRCSNGYKDFSHNFRAKSICYVYLHVSCTIAKIGGSDHCRIIVRCRGYQALTARPFWVARITCCPECGNAQARTHRKLLQRVANGWAASCESASLRHPDNTGTPVVVRATRTRHDGYPWRRAATSASLASQAALS